MIRIPVQQDVDLWEVWIEYNEFDPGSFGTLYVIGEVVVDASLQPPFITKAGERNEGELVLRVPPITGPRTKIKEVLYSEAVASVCPYERILVYCGETLIASFDEIEVMI